MTTSHFIAAKLQSDGFTNLFGTLESILGTDSNIVEFQNDTLPHATLFYLPADISDDLEDLYRAVLEKNALRWNIAIAGFGYFVRDDIPTVCFLSPVDRGDCARANDDLRGRFPAYTPWGENRLPFVAHITLFRIIDPVAYERRRNLTEDAIRTWMERFDQIDLFERVSLFAADSTDRPEKQWELGHTGKSLA
ncbi:MAG TPA: hypothetical protein PK765_05785 [bacterium]|nr:hypothetical protein [bacterium]